MAFTKQKFLQKSKLENAKRPEREIFEKYVNLSVDELSEKSNKNVYVKNNVMTTVIKRCRGKKKEVKKKKRWIQKKIYDSRICDIRMSRTQSQIKNRKHICE